MLGGHFDLADLGAYELKGFAEPVPVWRVRAARDVESRFAATRTGSTAPLIGRQEEMGLLLRAWDGSSHGRGIDAALCRQMLDQELAKWRETGRGGRYEDVARLFVELIEAPTFPEF